MNIRTMRAALVGLIMIMSSLAGCLSTDEIETEEEMLGKVIASTYHVEQLLSAVAGDLVEVELLSTTNIPVHDYEPTANDILRLQGADVFFYHGLGLEPWVETTLSGLSTAAPTSVSTHAMPTGETTLDYETILIGELCEHLSDGPFENTILAMNTDTLPEIHAEHVTHTMSFPEMGDDHDDDHDDHDDEHDGHGDDDHEEHADDDHDDHEGHGHASPMETITNPNGCPTDYVIVIYELEKGDLVIEFESEDDHDFNMVALKMGGGHAHHHHDHDDHDEHDDHDDEITEEDCERRNGTWEEAPDRVGVFYCDFGHGEHDDHDDHDNREDHGDHHDDEMTPEITLQSFDSNNDSHISWDEFWAGWTSEDHDDHGDEEHDECVMEHCAGQCATDPESPSCDACIDAHCNDDDHDDHGDHDGMMMEMMFNMTDANSDGVVNASELERLMEMGDDHHDDQHGVIGFANLHIEAEGEYGFLLPSDVTMHVLMSRDAHEGHGHDDHGDEDRDRDDHDDHGDEDRDGNDDHDGHDDHAVEEIPFDPHSWLDPLAFKAQIDVVLDALIAAFPSGNETFTANADAYKLQLDALANGFENAFGENGTCTGEKSIAANHSAYSYLAQRYDIEFVTIHGLDPEGEPTAENIAEVVEKITEEEITVFYVEEYTDLSSVDSIVSQTGVTILYLYTMEMAPSTDGEDYLSLMQKNLDNLITGIGC